MKNTRTAIIDTHAVCHYLKHSLRHLHTGGIGATGIIFGFLSQMKQVSEATGQDRFIFCWDSRKSLRRRLFSEYKNKRGKTKVEATPEEASEDREMYAQIDTLRKVIIPSLGFSNSFIQTGFEADDIIASCVISLPGKKYIVSRDNDLHQLINSETSMWDFQKKVFFTKTDFEVKWGIDPYKWRLVKAIGGCTSDEVPGVPGVGELTAVKYIKGDLPNHYKTYKAIQDGQAVIERNKPLVVLPFKGTPKYRIQNDNISLSAFWDMCEEYQFNSILANFDDWVESFSME